MRSWRRRVAATPDAALRAHASRAAAKRGNIEGAAIFATFSPRRGRATAIRSAVAFQAAYNYLDMVGEQPVVDPVESVGRLHGALPAALASRVAHADYYELVGGGDDGGYLRAMVDACSEALAQLPSAPTIAVAAQVAAERVVAFQALNLSERNGDHELLAHWSAAATPAGSDLRWWETGAAAGSSLGVHVLIAAAVDHSLSGVEVKALERAYFPWIGALHSLLDSLVDVVEDERTGQRSLVSYYGGPEQAAVRMRWLVKRCDAAARSLPGGNRHRLVLAAMTALYMSELTAATPKLAAVDPPLSRTRSTILDAAGPAARAALSMFVVRRVLSRQTDSIVGRDSMFRIIFHARAA